VQSEPEQARTLLERAGGAAAGLGSLGGRRPAVRAAIQWGLAALIFGSLVLFVLRQWSKLPNFEWRFAPGWLAASGTAVLLFYFLQCEIWRLIMHALGEERLEPGPARAVWGKSLIARYVPTNVLLVVGRVVMVERLGASKRVCLASIAYELGLQLGTAVMVGAYFVIELPALHGHPGRFAVLALIPPVLVALHPRVFAPAANYGLKKLGRQPLPRTLPFSRVLGFALMYVVCWAVIGLGVFAFASALHPLDASDLPYLGSAYPVAFCVAVITFIVPSGLGTRDATLATAMSAVLAGTVATAIAVAFRIFQTAMELLYVGTVVGLDRRSG
jgi:glycosyltransferase 2 family protein